MTTRRTKSPRIWLQAHLDVVPASPALFIPTIRGRRMVGRGAFDMKFAIAIYLAVLRHFGGRLRDLDLGVMLTADEEVGGRDGVRSLLFRDGYRGALCFLPDSGDNWRFESAAKGVLRVRIASAGKAAHSARPWLGDDANRALVAYLNELFRAFDALASDDPERAPYPTAVAGTLRGGEAVNQVSASAIAELDIRFPSTSSRQEILRLLRRIPRPRGIAIHELRHSTAYENDLSDTHHRRFAEIVRQIRGRRPGVAYSHGSSDARHFRNLGIPVILIRPRGGGQHSANEWVDLPDLAIYAQCLARFIEETATREGRKTKAGGQKRGQRPNRTP